MSAGQQEQSKSFIPDKEFTPEDTASQLALALCTGNADKVYRLLIEDQGNPLLPIISGFPVIIPGKPGAKTFNNPFDALLANPGKLNIYSLWCLLKKDFRPSPQQRALILPLLNYKSAPNHVVDTIQDFFTRKETPLISRKTTPLHNTADKMQSIQPLLAGGAVPLDFPDDDGETVLFTAARGEHFEVVKLLLDHKPAANVEHRNKARLTAGQVSQVPSDPTAETLATISRLEYQTPLHEAIRKLPSSNPALDIAIAAIRIDKSQIDDQDFTGQTPLHLAAKMGNATLISLLIKNGANLYIPDNNNKLPRDLYKVPLDKAAKDDPVQIALEMVSKKADQKLFSSSSTSSSTSTASQSASPALSRNVYFSSSSSASSTSSLSSSSSNGSASSASSLSSSTSSSSASSSSSRSTSTLSSQRDGKTSLSSFQPVEAELNYANITEKLATALSNGNADAVYRILIKVRGVPSKVEAKQLQFPVTIPGEPGPKTFTNLFDALMAAKQLNCYSLWCLLEKDMLPTEQQKLLILRKLNEQVPAPSAPTQVKRKIEAVLSPDDPLQKLHEILETELHQKIMSTSGVQEILANGSVPIDFPSFYEGRSALHKAADYGCCDVVNLLLIHKPPANVALRDNKQRTAAQLLKKSKNPGADEANAILRLEYQTELHRAIRELAKLNKNIFSRELGNITDQLKLFNLQVSLSSSSASASAAASSSTSTALRPFRPVSGGRYLDEINQSMLKEQDYLGKTPLHLAAELGNVDLVRALCDSDPEIKENINIQDNFGKTPLHYAAAIGNAELIGILTDNGADRTIGDKASKLPGFYYKAPNFFSKSDEDLVAQYALGLLSNKAVLKQTKREEQIVDAKKIKGLPPELLPSVSSSSSASSSTASPASLSSVSSPAYSSSSMAGTFSAVTAAMSAATPVEQHPEEDGEVLINTHPGQSIAALAIAAASGSSPLYSTPVSQSQSSSSASLSSGVTAENAGNTERVGIIS